MMLQARNFKLCLLAALLVGAAGSLSATEYGSGLFSVSATKSVRFAPSNYHEGEKQFFTFAEVQAIEAAGNEILTIDEWQYLFGHPEAVGGGRAHAYELFALAQVDGVNGLVILPDYDTWVLPAGLEFHYKETGDAYDKNIYSSTDWDRMAAAGAIFLPAAGYSMDPAGIVPTDYKVHGKYWTCTVYNETKAYAFQFDPGYFYDFAIPEKANRYSVRIVEGNILLNENDAQSTFEAKLEAAKTKSDDAHILRTLKKDGTFYTLCLPFSIPDISTTPLADAEVYTFTSATVEGSNSLDINITPYMSTTLYHSTPYLVRWPNTGETLKIMSFSGITWDNDTETDDAGTGNVKFCGFYHKKHIVDETDGERHLYLFLGANNKLFWPVEDDPTDMKGFRAYFQISTGGGASLMPIRRGMSVRLRIMSVATDIEDVQDYNTQSKKVLLNGQIVIINNGNIYTLNGQKL